MTLQKDFFEPEHPITICTRIRGYLQNLAFIARTQTNPKIELEIWKEIDSIVNELRKLEEI